MGFKVGVNQGQHGYESTATMFLQTLVKETISQEIETDFFDEVNETALSVIDKNKEFDLDTELPIAAYGVAGFDSENTVSSIDINESVKIGNNEGDFIVYLKLRKVN